MQRGEGATKFRYDLPILGTALGNRQILILEKKMIAFDKTHLHYCILQLGFLLRSNDSPYLLNNSFLKERLSDGVRE